MKKKKLKIKSITHKANIKWIKETQKIKFVEKNMIKIKMICDSFFFLMWFFFFLKKLKMLFLFGLNIKIWKLIFTDHNSICWFFFFFEHFFYKKTHFNIRFLLSLSINLWAWFNRLSELDTATCWCCKWCLAALAENWNIRMGKCCCELCACWATEREELGAWVWNKCLLLVHVELLLWCWVENIAIECWHLVKGRPRCHF